MSDNLKMLKERIATDIDPSGAPGSILAENHKAILNEVLDKVGRNTGFGFRANKILTVFQSGSMSWESNAMNILTNFEIKVSKLTLDLNDIGHVLELLNEGDLIKFKDFVGRSVFLEYVSHVADVDGSSNPIYILTVKGKAENINYTYQDNEIELCSFDFKKGSSPASLLEVSSINFVDELTFDNVLGVFHSEQTQNAPINLTVSALGNKPGSVLYKRILFDGINPINFDANKFDILHGITNGEILTNDIHELYFLYKPNGKVTVNVLKPDEIPVVLYWKNFVDTYQETGTNNLLREDVAPGWSASAHSIDEILTGEDAVFQFEVDNAGLLANDSKRSVGLNNVSTNNSFNDIDFSISVSNRGSGVPFATIFEKGIVKGTNQENLVNGDIFKIQVLNNVVTYYLNDVLWYTSDQTPVFPLFIDCTLFGIQSKITNPLITRL
jgi:hypothetical protein